MKFNTNSNVYIIIYSVVMVVVVATLLAVASLSLRERQNRNMLNEKQQQIVTALGENPEQTPYADLIAEALLLNEKGEVISTDEQKVFEVANALRDAFQNNTLPLFKAKSGAVVVPVYGAGLWGPIWGYVALESDMNTIKGIVLDHQGETPGLGAEIATPKHQAMYKGKQIYGESGLVGITLRKGGAKDPNHEVDAITGGTKTSDGVSDMLGSNPDKGSCFVKYQPYFDAVRAAAAAATAEVAEESNVINDENNGK